jgi:hypothetical protein
VGIVRRREESGERDIRREMVAWTGRDGCGTEL